MSDKKNQNDRNHSNLWWSWDKLHSLIAIIWWWRTALYIYQWQSTKPMLNLWWHMLWGVWSMSYQWNYKNESECHVVRSLKSLMIITLVVTAANSIADRGRHRQVSLSEVEQRIRPADAGRPGRSAEAGERHWCCRNILARVLQLCQHVVSFLSSDMPVVVRNVWLIFRIQLNNAAFVNIWNHRVVNWRYIPLLCKTSSCLARL